MAFQDRAHTLEKHFCPGNWKEKSTKGRQHQQNPQLGLAVGGCTWKFLLSLLNSTEMCGANPSWGRKEGAEPQWRRLRAEGWGEPEETLLLHAGFGSPKLCLTAGTGAGVWVGTETILSSLSVHKDWSLRVPAAGVPHEWNTWLLYTVEKKYLAFYLFTCWFIISNHNKLKALHIGVKPLREVKSHLSCCCKHRIEPGCGSLKLAQVLPAAACKHSSLMWPELPG